MGDQLKSSSAFELEPNVGSAISTCLIFPLGSYNGADDDDQDGEGHSFLIFTIFSARMDSVILIYVQGPIFKGFTQRSHDEIVKEQKEILNNFSSNLRRRRRTIKRKSVRRV